MTIQDLLNQIEPFCIEYKIGKSQFGKLSCNNPNLINDLRGGQSPTLTTVHRVLKFLYEYKREKDREMARFYKPKGFTGTTPNETTELMIRKGLISEPYVKAIRKGTTDDK